MNLLLPDEQTNPFDYVRFIYQTFKREVYAQRHNLQLRERVAQFEAAPDFESRLHTVANVIFSSHPANQPDFHSWLAEIDFTFLPKKIDSPNEERRKKEREVNRWAEPIFYTNLATSSAYYSSRVNYFFDGPVELHLISAAWVLLEGYLLDRDLADCCMGARLHPIIQKHAGAVPKLFKSYASQYARWRDDAIKCAKDLLKNKKTDVCILSLDFEQFFYRLRPNFYEIQSFLKQSGHPRRSGTGPRVKTLIYAIEQICLRYREKIQQFLPITHTGLDAAVGLPIEISFAPVIANWCLRHFDKQVQEQVNPFYYARYVDDILLVLPAYGVSNDDPVDAIMQRQFVERGVFEKMGHIYRLSRDPEIRLQKEKCLLHHFDAKHSIAGLDNFSQRVNDLTSEFFELPGEQFDQPFKEVAWELLYEGSEFKWRSMTGIGEDKNALASYLHKRCQLAVFTKSENGLDSASDLEAFFQGRNALQYFELWERLFTLLALTEDSQTAERIKTTLTESLSLLEFRERAQPNSTLGHLNQRLRRSLLAHLRISIAMAAAAGEIVERVFVLDESTYQLAYNIRRSKLVRHSFEKRSLTNWPDEGEQEFGLDADDLEVAQSTVLAEASLVRYAPRFYRWDELILDACKAISQKPNAANAYETAKKTYRTVNGMDIADDVIVECEEVENE